MTREEAREGGEQFYIGTPCKVCACTRRYTSSTNCADCRQRRNRGDYGRERHLKNRYGITLEDWQQMFDNQNGCCEICLEEFSSARETHVDHCHETGKVRGLLCQGCNTALGQFREDVARLERAIQYLTAH